MNWFLDHWPWISGSLIPFLAGWLQRQRLAELLGRLRATWQRFRDIEAVRKELAHCQFNRELADRNLVIARQSAENLTGAMEALLAQGEAMGKIIHETTMLPGVPKNWPGVPTILPRTSHPSSPKSRRAPKADRSS